MITIEVLISMLILFMVIATSIATIKQLKIVREQQVHHEELYMLILNVKDFIDDDICEKQFSMQGEFDDYQYRATCEKQNELRSYVKAFGVVDVDNVEGNTGNVLISFYKITLDITKHKLQKHYLYFKTTTKKLQ